MANNKFYGYSPDPSKEAEGNRLDRLNPYEFRKGMDYELTALGCSRLAESTLEEREKATESVLKNIQEHNGYYTSLITYETTYRNSDDKPTFKKWLSEQEDFKMKEVDEKFDNDKMVELKETIKARVRKLMKEYANPEDEMMDRDDEDERDGWMGAVDAKDVHIDLGVSEENRRLEDCINEYEIFIIDYLATGAILSLFTDSPVIYFNIGLRRPSKSFRTDLEQRCLVVPVELSFNLKDQIMNGLFAYSDSSRTWSNIGLKKYSIPAQATYHPIKVIQELIWSKK